MGRKEDIIGYDFQGWPVYKRNLGFILDYLGARWFRTDDGREVLGFPADSEELKSYPVTLEDDGMGYGVNMMYVTGAEEGHDGKSPRLWIAADYMMEDGESE